MNLLLPTIAPYNNSHFSSYFSLDYTILHLDYYPIKNDQYNEFFEQMNDSYHIYSQVQTLYICTDFINKLPTNILQFKVLKKLTINGSRWWDLNMTQIPNTIEIVELINQSNLQPASIIGCEQLINLKILKLDADAFNIKIRTNDYCTTYFDCKCNFDDIMGCDCPPGCQLDKKYSIPNLPNLTTIMFQSGELLVDDLFLDNTIWKNDILNHPVLSRVKHRIKSITCDGDHYIEIKLTC